MSSSQTTQQQRVQQHQNVLALPPPPPPSSQVAGLVPDREEIQLEDGETELLPQVDQPPPPPPRPHRPAGRENDELQQFHPTDQVSNPEALNMVLDAFQMSAEILEKVLTVGAIPSQIHEYWDDQDGPARYHG